MKRKTSLQITREENGDCSIHVRFSDKDLERKDANAVLQELLRDASSQEFYDFIPDKPTSQPPSGS